MPNDVKLSSFPSGHTEALAYLYLQNQDLSGKTPSEIQTMYYEAYFEIQKDYREKNATGWFRERKGT